MNFKEREEKWKNYWQKNKTFSFDKNNTKNKKYILSMFSYPSAAKLHIGHCFNFTSPDAYSKYLKMKGVNVFQPMGFDAFGLPAENYAIKTNIHPKDSTVINMNGAKEQLINAEYTYDWDYEVRTCDPTYYKWTQYLFIQLFNKGLAYQKFAPVNWCPSCQTVLANEQVVDGICDRCKSQVVRKNLTQWFFKITDYAEKLLNDLDKINWPSKTKLSQKNWIGKSEGAEVVFLSENGNEIKVFTSRADTLFGVSYIVVAPEHPLIQKLITETQKDAVEKYISESSKKDEITRQSTTLEKTGVFTGSYAINPINGKKVPIWTSDYVLATYGTGAVMGVPAHDERDFMFANKFNLPIIQVIEKENEKTVLPFTEQGILINSEEFNGINSDLARKQIVEKLIKINKGNFKINYKLRDWSVSRQRYWGCPIPIIHCDKCGAVPVPEKDLPITLPNVTDYKPKGHGPLASVEEYINTTCPKCGGKAKRDPDTLDTFVCSSFYQLRFPNAQNDKEFLNKEFTNEVCPVDYYIGGMEHANSHLLYSRFITKFLYDEGFINFNEPFTKLIHQGMILGPDGTKMSKSKGNTLAPDELINTYGADALRLYMIFGFNFELGGPWSDNGLQSCAKYIERVERIFEKIQLLDENKSTAKYEKAEEELDYVRNSTIKEYEKIMPEFNHNSAVAKIMELTNAISKYDLEENKNIKLMKNAFVDMIKLLAPFTPALSEEIWEQMGNKTSIFLSGFPKFEEEKTVKNEIEIVVQINSKISGRINIKKSMTNSEIENLAKESIKEKLDGKSVVKSIIIPDRLINFIVK